MVRCNRRGVVPMTPSTLIALCGVAVTAAAWGGMHWPARQHTVTLGFCVDQRVTFDLPHLAGRGGPLTPDERAGVMRDAREEIVDAFAGLRVRVTDARDAFYRVRVVQVLTFRRIAVSGQSNVFGPLGGVGAVSFETLASQAVARAPAGADRQTIVAGIGRGLGRAAVHEFAHLLLPRVPLHATTDASSYEFWTSDRVSQYYGPMRWDLARPHLVSRLGR